MSFEPNYKKLGLKKHQVWPYVLAKLKENKKAIKKHAMEGEPVQFILGNRMFTL